MSGLQCLYNSRRALYRVFICPAVRLEASLLAQQLPSLSQQLASRNSALGGQIRAYPGSARPRRNLPPRTESADPDDDDRGFDRRFTTQRDIDRSGRSRPPQDHEITDPQIMVIDNGASEGPLNTRFVLTKLDAEESLRMIQPYIPANTKDGKPAQYAVCKIVNKRAEYARRKELKEKRGGTGKPKTKELELTWAIGAHDLATKMRKMGEFLSKGMKVEVMIGRKKGMRPVTAEEAEAVVAKVREEVGVHKGREGKPATGEAGGTMKLYLEGVAQK